MNGTRNLVLSVGALVAISWAVPVSAEDTLALKAKTVHLGNGKTISDGAVVMRDGEIIAVGGANVVPSDATVIELDRGSITPGLIDANAVVERSDRMMLSNGPRSAREVLHDIFLGYNHNHVVGVDCCGSTCPKSFLHATGDLCPVCGFPNQHVTGANAVGVSRSGFVTEQSSEVVPHTRVLDSINLYSPDFDRLAEGGVTTVFVTAHSSAVVGSKGAILRTAGDANDRVIQEEGAVKATVGADPSWRSTRNQLPFRRSVSFYNRRPTTRMGVTWIFRKAFHDAKRAKAGLELHGADVPPVEAIPVLQQVLEGNIPLRIQARTYPDIKTALRLTDEFGMTFVLEEAIEAYKAIGDLEARNIPVVFGPIFIDAPGYRGQGFDRFESRLHTFDKLLESSLSTALTAHELRDEDGLARQGMYAVRMGSDAGKVLASMTSTPAKILGIDDQVGTLESGKRADLVLWSGEPFDATSEAMVVVSGGEVVVDRRGS